MYEIKAYIRTSYLEKTVQSLKKSGAPGITVVTVHPVGYGFEKRFSMNETKDSGRYYDITKIELVCDDEDLDTFVDAILETAHTGASGDGLIFVSEVEQVIKIRTRRKGTRISDVTGR